MGENVTERCLLTRLCYCILLYSSVAHARSLRYVHRCSLPAPACLRRRTFLAKLFPLALALSFFVCLASYEETR